MATLTEKQKASQKIHRKKVTDLNKRIKKLRAAGDNKGVVKLKKELARRNKNLQTFRNIETGKTRKPAPAPKPATAPTAGPDRQRNQFRANTGNKAIDDLVNTLFSSEGPRRRPLSDFGFETDPAKRAAEATVAESFDEERERARRDFASDTGRENVDFQRFQSDTDIARSRGQQDLDTLLQQIIQDRSNATTTRDTNLGRILQTRNTEREGEDRAFNVQQEQALQDIAIAGQTFSGRRGRTFNAIEDARLVDIGGIQRRFQEGGDDTRREFNLFSQGLDESQRLGQQAFKRFGADLDIGLRDRRTAGKRFLTDLGTDFRRGGIDRRRRRTTAEAEEVQRLQGVAVGKRNRDFERRSQNFNPFI